MRQGSSPSIADTIFPAHKMIKKNSHLPRLCERTPSRFKRDQNFKSRTQGKSWAPKMDESSYSDLTQLGKYVKSQDKRSRINRNFDFQFVGNDAPYDTPIYVDG